MWSMTAPPIPRPMSSRPRRRSPCSTYPVNQGKGAALRTGFAAAAPTCDWAMTIDADGQHRAPEGRILLDAARQRTRVLVVGTRQGMSGEHVPWTSRFGRGFSNFWVWVAGGPWIADSQSGFRLYPLPETLELAVQARRYQFEVEVLVRADKPASPLSRCRCRWSTSPGGCG